MAAKPNTTNLDTPQRGLPAQGIYDSAVSKIPATTTLDVPSRGLPVMTVQAGYVANANSNKNRMLMGIG